MDDQENAAATCWAIYFIIITPLAAASNSYEILAAWLAMGVGMDTEEV